MAEVGIYRHKTTGEKIAVKKSPTPTEAANEVLAAQLAEVIGARVPAARRIDIRTTAHDFVEGATGTKTIMGQGREHWDELVASPDGTDLAIFDAITGQDDRHRNNVMVGDDGRLYGIDHGFSWASLKGLDGRPRFPGVFGDPAARDDVSVERLEGMRPGLEAMRATFKATFPRAVDSDAIHAAMMSNLDALIEHVRETREANGLDP